MKDDPVLKAIAARLDCVGELIHRGDLTGALAVIDKCLKILPAPDTANLLCAMHEAGYKLLKDS